jgi:hypothetical protein
MYKFGLVIKKFSMEFSWVLKLTLNDKNKKNNVGRILKDTETNKNHCDRIGSSKIESAHLKILFLTNMAFRIKKNNNLVE